MDDIVYNGLATQEAYISFHIIISRVLKVYG